MDAASSSSKATRCAECNLAFSCPADLAIHRNTRVHEHMMAFVVRNLWPGTLKLIAHGLLLQLKQPTGY